MEKAMEKATLRVTGMTCGNCVKHVTKALNKAGIPDPRVDLPSGKVELTYDPSTVSLATLTEAVGKAGYPATVME
jgi:copper chaperone